MRHVTTSKIGSIRLKIFLLGTNITTGGAQKVLLDLAKWFFNQGIDVTAAFFYDRDNLYEEWKSQNSFPIICLDAWSNSDNKIQRFARLAKGWFKLLKNLKHGEYSGILTFTHDSNLLGLPAAWLAGVPIRYGSHHVRYPSLSKFRILLHRLIINSRIATGLIAVSGFTKEQAVEEGVSDNKIKIIYNGIDPQLFSQKCTNESQPISDKDKFIILSVGRLVEQKGHAYLIDSASKVLETFPNATFYLAGDGPLFNPYKSKINDLGLSGRFVLLGNRDDIPKLLADSDLFVFPSLYEGLPISLLEALASGVPVICSAIPAVSDIICDGQNGKLVPVRDSKALAKGIIEVLCSETLRTKFSINGRKLVEERFSISNMGYNYKKLFEENFINASQK